MLFWVIAAVLTLVASLAVLLPLAAKPKSKIAGSGHDLEVYRDQLSELDRDLARGLIQPAEAEQARAEVARRIIRLGGEEKLDSPTSRPASTKLRLISAAAVLAVPLISWGTYARLGSPDLPSQPLSERLAKNPGESSVDELVARAEAHLSANPTDGQGWDVLAPVYLRMQRFGDAANAYRNAIRLLEPSSDRQSGLGEALVNADGGKISADAKLAFEASLKLDPSNPKASFFVAMGLAQDGRKDEAVATWQKMRAGLPQGSPWLDAVDQALARAEAPQAPAANGPSKEEMEAAASMSSEDRASMIAGMVARLDEKLKLNPKDAEGWMQLIRSYLVVGDAEKARDALNRAVSVFGPDSEQAKKFVAFASSNGLEVAE
ncbi:cytochrome C [Mesorhizobium sp. Root157]|uniref:c-type cytochrome biogenesis protein CcmI n=1 Tax=Mesorhizobium sp. Root157 TaxID=1736477 RepID=UPI0006F55F8B|nr:c-type cytochrome biogenesis protein CcmI [Mesorhizobium sp. Root157]KQZ94210.1 cytochrome C [Mesorhizobium sp. Root157]